MSGFLGLRIPLLARRVITMAPALAVLAWNVDPTDILNLSQVVLSFGIPFALIPLIVISRRREVMGTFTLAGCALAVMAVIAVVVVALNAYLVVGQLGAALSG